MSTTTNRYHWNKPDPGGSANTWGSLLNGTTDKIDEQVYQNQQGVSQVGFIALFAGATAPDNWMICNGASLDQNTYKTLFAVIGTAYGQTDGPGNFNLPNLVDSFPIGAGTNALGAQGGSNAATISVDNLPAHNHPASQVPHNHPNAYQDVHTHIITTGNHAHGIHTGGHAHTVPNVPLFTAGGGVAGGSGAVLGTQTTSSVGDLGGNTDTAGNLGGTADPRQPVLRIDSAQPAVTVFNTGNGTPLPITPAFSAINYIIRYQ